MKKIIVILISLLLLTGCQQTDDANVKLYREMINILSSAEEYNANSKYYSVAFETTDTNDGKRFYIVVDNPTMAMYDVNIIAFENGADTENEFIPNAGIFEGEINLVPNQYNKDKGFVKGVSISGLVTSDNPVIYCLVQWKDENNSKIYREFLKFSK